ncbi:MAG: hypothetical protein RR334_03535, partial [Clostridia bacterium]
YMSKKYMIEEKPIEKANIVVPDYYKDNEDIIMYKNCDILDKKLPKNAIENLKELVALRTAFENKELSNEEIDNILLDYKQQYFDTVRKYLNYAHLNEELEDRLQKFCFFAKEIIALGAVLAGSAIFSHLIPGINSSLFTVSCVTLFGASRVFTSFKVPKMLKNNILINRYDKELLNIESKYINYSFAQNPELIDKKYFLIINEELRKPAVFEEFGIDPYERDIIKNESQNTAYTYKRAIWKEYDEIARKFNYHGDIIDPNTGHPILIVVPEDPTRTVYVHDEVIDGIKYTIYSDEEALQLLKSIKELDELPKFKDDSNDEALTK